MKKIILLLSVFVSLGAFAQKEDAMVINKANGDCFAIKTDSIDYVEFAQSNKLNKDLFNLKQTVYVHDTIKVQIHDTINVIVKDTLKLIPSGLEAVDLALPSGNLWANMNIGAKKPTDFGAYIAWGETKEKDWYTQGAYKYRADNGTYTKYTTNGCSLDSEDDAASVNWGLEWSIPKYVDFEELMNSCTYIYTKIDGVNGYKFTGGNGNSIFLPAAEMGSSTDDTINYNRYCAYWINRCEHYKTNGNSANYFYGESTSKELSYCMKNCGLSVRPIKKATK